MQQGENTAGVKGTAEITDTATCSQAGYVVVLLLPTGPHLLEITLT